MSEIEIKFLYQQITYLKNLTENTNPETTYPIHYVLNLLVQKLTQLKREKLAHHKLYTKLISPA